MLFFFFPQFLFFVCLKVVSFCFQTWYLQCLFPSFVQLTNTMINWAHIKWHSFSMTFSSNSDKIGKNVMPGSGY